MRAVSLILLSTLQNRVYKNNCRLPCRAGGGSFVGGVLLGEKVGEGY